MSDRHQFRAHWHDYNRGVYFVTICSANKEHYLGKINDGKIILSLAGHIADTVIQDLPQHISDVEVWNYVIMPNHIHLIIAVGTCHGTSASSIASTPDSRNIGCLKPMRHDPPASQDFHHNSRLAVVIGQLKSSVKRIANKRNIEFKWQQRYHEHIIHNQTAYENIMNYIDSNVERWESDIFK